MTKRAMGVDIDVVDGDIGVVGGDIGVVGVVGGSGVEAGGPDLAGHAAEGEEGPEAVGGHP